MVVTIHGQLVKTDSSIDLPIVVEANAALAPQVHVSLSSLVGGASDIDTSSVPREESLEVVTWLMISALAVNASVACLGSEDLREVEPIIPRGGARLMTD